MLQQSQYNATAGKIETEESRGKLKFYAFNHQRGTRLHIGSLIGATYEKQAQILRQPEPSLTLTAQELITARAAGGEFIRFIVPTESGKQTYSISAADFNRNSETFHNNLYGPQLRVSLRHFAFSNTAVKRNAQTDNPVIEQDNDNSLPVHKSSQMPLFAGWVDR